MAETFEVMLDTTLQRYEINCFDKTTAETCSI